ncbi:MAG: acyl-ACP thioesterase domain-containing protein [Anaerovoracaceae bacterium]|jgi:acyl-ACP thioesterase
MDPKETHIKNTETSYIHQLDVEVFYLNENRIMKPSAYQALFAQLAERHLDIFHAGASETMKHGLAWALISMSIEINRPIDSCIKLFGHTWYSQRRGPYFRRELVFRNEDGDIMFQGSTFSILLEVATRKVFRGKEAPFILTEPTGVFCTQADHHFRENVEFTPCSTREIYSSDIDLLGHVNNRRYGDFAYDALTEEERLRLRDMRRMELYFMSEMRREDNFTIFKRAEENRILLRGHNNTKEDTSFDIVFSF